MVVITIVRWGYKPTYNVWGPHIVPDGGMVIWKLVCMGILGHMVKDWVSYMKGFLAANIMKEIHDCRSVLSFF